MNPPTCHQYIRRKSQFPNICDTGLATLQITAPPSKPKKDATPSQITGREAARKQQSSRRICVEHAIAEPKQWRPLQRYLGRREHFGDTALAIAGLVSDRTAER